MRMDRRRKVLGFTLIELLVVISIIALLISLLLPALGKVKGTENNLICSTHQRGLFQSVVVYGGDYNTGGPYRSASSASDITGYDYSFNPMSGDMVWGNVRWDYNHTTGQTVGGDAYSAATPDGGNSQVNGPLGLGICVWNSYSSQAMLYCPAKSAVYTTPAPGGGYQWGTGNNVYPELGRFWANRQWLFGQAYQAANCFTSSNTSWDGIVSPNNTADTPGYHSDPANVNDFYECDYDWRSGDWSSSYTQNAFGTTKGAKLGAIQTYAGLVLGKADRSQRYLKTDADGYTFKVQMVDNSEQVGGNATPHNYNGSTGGSYYTIGDGSSKLIMLDGTYKDSAGLPYNYYPWGSIKSGTTDLAYSGVIATAVTGGASAPSGQVKSKGNSAGQGAAAGGYCINWCLDSAGEFDVLDNYIINGPQ